MSTGASDLAEARSALAAIGPRLVQLVRASTHEGPVVGHWGTREVACHLSHAIQVDADAIAGKPIPPAELNPAGVAAATGELLRADPERDLEVLADRIEDLLAHFLEVSKAPAGDEVTWLGGVRLPASAVACHLLEEVLVHGYDMGAERPGAWTIAPEHAALALTGAAGPIVNAAGPLAFVDPARARGFKARARGSLRGHGTLTLVLDDGLRVMDDTPEPPDIRISADPTAMLLIMLGRLSAPRAALAGKVVVWGRRIWLLPRMLAAITPP